MKDLIKVLFKIFILFIVVCIPTFFLVYGKTREKVDEFYNRFLFEPSTNVILGSSRSAQGINPDLIFNNGGINFSFTISISPYGETYFKAIESIIDDKPGYAILEVNPSVLSEDCANVNDESKFRETRLMLANVNFYGIDPNFHYLFTSYKSPLYGLLLKNETKKFYLHRNGWLEVYQSKDSVSLEKMERNEKMVKRYFAKFCISEIRLDWLKKIINKLKKSNKKVYLIRMPIHSRIFELENKYWNDFDKRIAEIAESLDCMYFNYASNSTFITHDGNHLKSGEASRFSKILNHELKLH